MEDSMTKFLAFDIEIAKELPEGETDWKAHRPLGITCGAAAAADGLWNWYAHDDQGKFTDQMTGEQCRQMLNDLSYLVDKCGYTLTTWNGLGFDFDVLAEESGAHEACKRLALDHIDMMFHFFCEKGYPLGLDAAAKGMGLPGKPDGMSGALAPVLWTEGQYHKVLDYVSWDVKNTLMVAEASWQCQEWSAVEEALKLPLPDTDWMTDPWPRSQFYEWTGYEYIPPAPIDTSHLNPEDWTLYDDLE
jgi:hypothetical protein